MDEVYRGAVSQLKFACTMSGTVSGTVPGTCTVSGTMSCTMSGTVESLIILIIGYSPGA